MSAPDGLDRGAPSYAQQGPDAADRKQRAKTRLSSMDDPAGHYTDPPYATRSLDSTATPVSNDSTSSIGPGKRLFTNGLARHARREQLGHGGQLPPQRNNPSPRANPGHLDPGAAGQKKHQPLPASKGPAVRKNKLKSRSPSPEHTTESDEHEENYKTFARRRPAPKDTEHLARTGLMRKIARLEPNALTVDDASKPRHVHEGRPIGNKTPPRSPSKTGKAGVLCVNNKHDPRLLENGGRQRLGTPGQCVAKGFGAGLYQHIPPDGKEAFIKQFSVPYEKIISLDNILWFKNGEPPAGRHRATLPMCFQKGYGAGSAKLARKLKEEERRDAL